MIQHAVSMVWKEGVGDAELDALRELLDALPGEIPAVREYRFGPDLGLREGNADFAVLAVVEDEAALTEYLEHPFHLRVREQLERMTESRRAVQFALPSDEDEPRALYARLIAAWNGRDAEAFAGLFAPGGTAIGFDGSEMAGRAEIASALGEAFASHRTVPYATRLRSVRFVGPGAAVVRAVAGMMPPGKEELDPDLHAQHTVLAEGRPGGVAHRPLPEHPGAVPRPARGRRGADRGAARVGVGAGRACRGTARATAARGTPRSPR